MKFCENTVPALAGLGFNVYLSIFITYTTLCPKFLKPT